MKRFAVIGSPIAHSKSPQIHQAAFQALEMDDCTFESIEVQPDHLDEWIKHEFRRHYQGAAITIPHKINILKYIDAPTDSAIKIGAVNTLYWQEGRLIGTNTDGIGGLKAIETQIPTLKDKRVLILGAGGAARSLAFALSLSGAHTAIWNRTTTKARQLSDEFDIGLLENLEAEAFQLFDLIINATSVGLGTWKSVIPKSYWSPHQVAFDMVYQPLETRFLSEAQEAGCEAITGDKMLVYQALEQFKIWHDGVAPEPFVMEAAFLDDPQSQAFGIHPSDEVC